MTVQATVLMGVKGFNSGAGQLGTRMQEIALSANLAFTDGSGANQVNKSLSRGSAGLGTQIQSVNTDLDLSGSLLGDDGLTVTFTAVKAIALVAALANPGNLTLSPAPSNGFVGPFGASTHQIVLPPGGRIVLARSDAAGWTVTPGTADLLRIASAATAGTYLYDLCVLGI